MLSFNESMLTEQKNTHMTHIEDKVLYGGVDGTRQAINALRELRDMLGGAHKGNVSIKWDGAPAVFCGTDPNDGEFFVAKKSIFNKNPKVYKTAAEVDADTKGDLADKLKAALRYLPSLGIKGIIQGDFLFGPGDTKKEKINGEDLITFHPNTIVYAVPANSTAAREIKSAQIGIVWHTSYSGNDFASLKASYGVNVSAFKSSKNVWSQDAMLRDMTSMTMTAKETENVTKILSECGKLFNTISGTTLRSLESNKVLAQHIEQYNNTFVRSGTIIKNTTTHTAGLIRWIKGKYQKEIDKLKTEKGKNRRRDALNELLSFFSPANKQSLIRMFEMQKLIVLAKLKLIKSLNKLSKTKTVVKTKTSYKVTGEEGYVAIDKLGGDAVKIVDRMEFSYNNFSPDTLKGWDKPGR